MRKKPFHNLHDKILQQGLQEWLIDCFQSVIPVLVEFSTENFEKVKDEIRTSKDIMFSFGSATIVNNKY